MPNDLEAASSQPETSTISDRTQNLSRARSRSSSPEESSISGSVSNLSGNHTVAADPIRKDLLASTSSSTTQSVILDSQASLSQQNKNKRARTDSPAPSLISSSQQQPQPDLAVGDTPESKAIGDSNFSSSTSSSSFVPQALFPQSAVVDQRATNVKPPITLPNNLDQSNSMSIDQTEQAPVANSLSSTVQPPPPSYQDQSSTLPIPIKSRTVPESQLPSGSDQLEKISPLKNKSLKADDIWYLLPRRWYQLWATKCSSGAHQISKKPEEGEEVDQLEQEDLVLGPIKTMDLLQPGASLNDTVPPLKMGLVMGNDVEAVPKEAYELLESWYGLEGPSFPRNVISRNGDLRIELCPPRFNFIRIITGGAPDTKALPIPTTLSILTPYSELIRLAKRSFNYSRLFPNKGFRLLRIPVEIEKNLSSTEIKFDPGTELDWELVEGFNEAATLNDLQLDLPYQLLALEAGSGETNFPLRLKSHPMPRAPKRIPLFSQAKGSDSFSNLENKAALNNVSSAVEHPAANNSAYATRSSTFYERSLNRTAGVTGLQNLGNTCFMNSALQCLSNTPQLQNYFLEGAYKRELNSDNPLGMGGLLAESFGALLQRLWSSSGSSYTPREFKATLGKFAPQFLGYSQQDTQELLAFLLDGLHEDLNRILKKPYIEIPDWEGGGEKEMVEFARTQWELYKQRNDSVIVDLFQGQYKSTLVCPICENVSIKFDPFMYLTLPIPNKRKKRMTVHFISLDLTKPTLKLRLQLNEDDSISKLKTKILETVGLPHEKDSELKKLIIADVWDHAVYQWFSDYEPIDTIKGNDQIYCYQLDSTFNNPKLNFKQAFRYGTKSIEDIESEIPRPSKEDDVALVPIFSTVDSQYRREESFGIPFFVEIPTSRFDDLKAIEEIVLRGYSRFTNRKEELETFIEDRERFIRQLNSLGQSQDATEDSSKINGIHGHENGIDEGVLVEGAASAPQTNSNPNPSEDSWELVDGQNTQVRQVSLTQPQQQDSIIEIRPGEDDTMIVQKSDVVPDPAPISDSVPSQPEGINGTLDGSSLQEKLNLLKSQDDEQVSEPQVKTESNMSPFTMAIKIRSPSKLLPLSNDPTEDLAERFERLKVQREEYEKLQQSKTQSEETSVEEKGKGVEEDEDKEPFPLLFNGTGLVIKWKSEAKEYFFTGIENEHEKCHWGSLSDEIKDPALIKEEEDAKFSGRLVRSKKGITLEDCLKEFTKEEKLGEDDPWYCPKCKEFRQATKKFDLWKVPDILVVHLKRFSGGNRRNKLDDNIDFPTKSLDLSEYVVGTKIYQDLEVSGELPPKTIKVDQSGKMEGMDLDDNDEAVASDQPIYDLYAVDNHYGGLGGGHYTAYAKNSKDKCWYSFDDSSTSKVGDINSIKTPAAYLLFYCRRTEREIGGKTREVIASASAPQSVSGDDAMNVANSQQSPASNLASTSFLPPQEQSHESFSTLSNLGNQGGFTTASDHMKEASYGRRGIDENYDGVSSPDSDAANDWRGPAGYAAHSSSWDRTMESLARSPGSDAVSPPDTPPGDSDVTFNSPALFQDDDTSFGNGHVEHHQGDMEEYAGNVWDPQSSQVQVMNAPSPAPDTDGGSDPMQLDSSPKLA